MTIVQFVRNVEKPSVKRSRYLCIETAMYKQDFNASQDIQLRPQKIKQLSS